MPKLKQKQDCSEQVLQAAAQKMLQVFSNPQTVRQGLIATIESFDSQYRSQLREMLVRGKLQAEFYSLIDRGKMLRVPGCLYKSDPNSVPLDTSLPALPEVGVAIDRWTRGKDGLNAAIENRQEGQEGEKAMPTGINWVENLEGDRGGTVNPILGCSKDGRPDCAHCWAERTSARMKAMNVPQYAEGVTDKDGHWTGDVKFEPSQLIKLLTNPNGKGKPYFLESMGDLFHQAVDPYWQKLIFGCIALSPQNFYFLLTKRTSIAHDFLANLDILECIHLVSKHELLGGCVCSDRLDAAFSFYQLEREEIARKSGEIWVSDFDRDVLVNVIVGASCGVQSGVVDRIQSLYEIRKLGWQTWISAEPLLQQVDFGFDRRSGRIVDWLVMGGESNQGKFKAREFAIEWGADLQRQCERNRIPYHVKQLGHNPTLNGKRYKAKGQGEQLEDMPEILRVRQRPESALRSHQQMLHRFRSYAKACA